MESKQLDTLIIGAGIVGSSVAMHLARRGAGLGVCAIDLDLEGALSSSELNAGGVRATWGQIVNIQTSKVSIEYYASIAEEVGYRACGYLWMHDSKKMPAALKARELQLAQGWPVEEWSTTELRRRVPFIDKTDDIGGVLFSPRDGLVNPNRLKMHYREHAEAGGVKFFDRTRLIAATPHAQGFEVTLEKFNDQLSVEERAELYSGSGAGIERREEKWQVRRIVNCAGAWAPTVAQALGYECSSRPVRRQISLFDCREVDLTPYGMMIDPSGVYFHPEGTNGLAGFANSDEPPGVNYAYDGESFFQNHIWPALYERSTRFEALRHVTGWAGLYEVSPDETAIVGEARGVNLGRGRVFEAHSFSGHGAMHSYGVGLGLAELMTVGRYLTLNLSPLSSERFERGETLHERLVI
jgi:glycine/D-amino acid oxidase-like deaminating enzyme